MSDQTSRRNSTNSSSDSYHPEGPSLLKARCTSLGMWACVTIVVLFVMMLPGHLYIETSHYQFTVIGGFFVVILPLLLCLSASLFNSWTRNLLLHRLNLASGTAGMHCAQPEHNSHPSTSAHDPASESQFHVPAPTLNGPQGMSDDPPPYQVAINMPLPEHLLHPARNIETPPPPYSVK